MAKGNGRSNTSRATNTKSVVSRGSGRPKPVVAKAGYTQTRRRYGEGGKIK